MAVITQINDVAGRWTKPAMFFGKKVPCGITHIELVHTHHTFYEYELRWINKNAEQHTMPFEQTDETINAAWVAMKLTTC